MTHCQPGKPIHPLDELDAKRRYYLAELEAKFDLLVARLETLTPENLETLYNVCAEYDELINRINEKLSELEGSTPSGDNGKAYEELKALIKQLEANKVGVSVYNLAISQIKAQLATLSSGSNIPEVDFSPIYARLDSLESDIKQLAASIPNGDGNAEAIAALNERCAEIERALSELPTDNGESEAIALLQARCSTIEETIASLNHTETINSLLSRCTALEAAVAGLSSSSDVTFNSVTANRVVGAVYQ